MSKEQVFAETKAHIAHCGGSYSSWYAGIASDARDGLFSGHCVRGMVIHGFTAPVTRPG